MDFCPYARRLDVSVNLVKLLIAFLRTFKTNVIVACPSHTSIGVSSMQSNRCVVVAMAIDVIVTVTIDMVIVVLAAVVVVGQERGA